MSSFKDRENAFENKFAHDEQIDFATEARCCKLFGLWVADKLGLEGDDADTYAKKIVEANLEEPGFGDVLRKVQADLADKNLEIVQKVLETELDNALTEARMQIRAEG